MSPDVTMATKKGDVVCDTKPHDNRVRVSRSHRLIWISRMLYAMNLHDVAALNYEYYSCP